MAGLPENATRWLELTLRLAVAAVFVYAGVVKVWAPESLREAIEGYRLVPSWMEAVLAAYLPWLEIVCGLGLFWRRTASGAAALLGGLIVVFMMALTTAWWRGLDITCGCFSGTAEVNYPWLIARNLLILVGVGILLITDTKRWEPFCRRSTC